MSTSDKMLPQEIVDKIASYVTVEDLAQLFDVDKTWKASVLKQLKPIINDRLQVAVFDDGNETHSVELPFVGINKGLAIYKEPADSLDLPKETMWKMGNTHFCWRYANYPEVIVRVIRWIYCSGDLRNHFVHFNLDRYNFGRVKLGENMKRRAGKNLRKTYEDSTSTYVAYTMHFKDEHKNDIGMSWFRIHEVRLPLARLELGKSSMLL